MIRNYRNIKGFDMRAYQGVKSRLAIEFAGWTGTSKAFLYAYRGQEPVATHRYYSAHDIRSIRLDLMGLPGSASRPKTLPPVINVRMAKGGTGKTTIAANIASCMSMMGHRVLMIDGDPQSSLSGMFGVDWVTQDVTHVGELMRRASGKNEPANIRDAVIPLYDFAMLDLIPSNIEMASVDGWMMQIIGREQAFVKLLEKEIDFFSEYDAIVIDSAPSSSILTTAFMVASKTILAVVMAEGQSLGALNILQSNVQELNDHFPGSKYGIHIVVNRYNQSKKPHQDSLGQLADRYGNFLNDTIVRDFIGFLRETSGKNDGPSGPLLENEPNSVGSRDIIDLTKSLIKLYGVKLPDGTGIAS
jgi:chromosome partitioning protein